ncbi:SRPBCC family protein [Curtobacterium sp. 20TX0008]|uniref:SRPBCC family protein n=1 Tax=Curtobacterium sp. 20TX0008 TaxID=3022018 RepID=UPI00232C0270|nr:SRPBCC family protein [Curtobacterium sp. 20TX0008]MDB6425501.1 SRPBCC family protein [Curtobacterium sp. 20TX0008]
MTVAFRVVTEIAAPVERVFALSLDIGAHERSMADTDERAVAGTTSGTIGLGESVTWRARHFGIVWSMTSRITALEAPGRFVDEQVRGPFARFRHEHRFEPSADGTRMVDEVVFRAPLGPLGWLAERVALARYLPRLIAARNASLRDELERDGDGQLGASSPSAS